MNFELNTFLSIIERIKTHSMLYLDDARSLFKNPRAFYSIQLYHNNMMVDVPPEVFAKVNTLRRKIAEVESGMQEINKLTNELSEYFKDGK